MGAVGQRGGGDDGREGTAGRPGKRLHAVGIGHAVGQVGVGITGGSAGKGCDGDKCAAVGRALDNGAGGAQAMVFPGKIDAGGGDGGGDEIARGGGIGGDVGRRRRRRQQASGALGHHAVKVGVGLSQPGIAETRRGGRCGGCDRGVIHAVGRALDNEPGGRRGVVLPGKRDGGGRCRDGAWIRGGGGQRVNGAAGRGRSAGRVISNNLIGVVRRFRQARVSKRGDGRANVAGLRPGRSAVCAAIDLEAAEAVRIVRPGHRDGSRRARRRWRRWRRRDRWS